jgi:hypothetical protein
MMIATTQATMNARMTKVPLLGRIVLLVGPGSQVSAKAHGNGAHCDLRQSCRGDDLGGRDGGRQPRRKGKRHGQAIGHTDNAIADGFGPRKVLLDVGIVGMGYWSFASVDTSKTTLRVEPKQSLSKINSVRVAKGLDVGGSAHNDKSDRQRLGAHLCLQ